MSKTDRKAAKALVDETLESVEICPMSWAEKAKFFSDMSELFGYRVQVFEKHVEIHRPYKSKWNGTSGVVISVVRDYDDLFDVLDI